MLLWWLGLVGRIGRQLMGDGDGEASLPDDPLVGDFLPRGMSAAGVCDRCTYDPPARYHADARPSE